MRGTQEELVADAVEVAGVCDALELEEVPNPLGRLHVRTEAQLPLLVAVLGSGKVDKEMTLGEWET